MPEIIFNGTAGRLEGRVTLANQPHAPMVVIMHPHPMHGGNMSNKITYQMHQIFAAQGFSTMRFNFRGVGRSQGTYDEGVGELADAISALEWLQSVHKTTGPMWVAGFSFGAWIAMQVLMRRPELSGFVAISPPANMYDFSFLAPCPCGGLVMHGDQDKVVPERHVHELVKKLREQRGKTAIDYRVLDGANHFYHGVEDVLQTQLTHYLSQQQQYRMAAE